MLTFLPEQSKREVKREYYARVLILFLGAICLLTIYSISIIVPTYTFSVYEKDRLAQEVQDIDLESAKCAKSESGCVDPTLQIKSANLLLNTLKDDNRVLISLPILEILAHKNKSIKITAIKYQNQLSSDQYQLSINGVSLDREGLLAFSNDLKKDARFSSVNLPISDFVKSANIDFVLTINIKK